MNKFEYLNLHTWYNFLFMKMNRIYLNIKNNLAVFSFLNAFLNFKKQESKKKQRSQGNPGDINI